MAEWYVTRIFQKAWSTTVSDLSFDRPRVIVIKFIVVCITIFVMFSYGWDHLIEDVIGEKLALLIALLAVFPTLLLLNLVVAPSLLQKESDKLQLQSENRIQELENQITDNMPQLVGIVEQFSCGEMAYDRSYLGIMLNLGISNIGRAASIADFYKATVRIEGVEYPLRPQRIGKYGITVENVTITSSDSIFDKTMETAIQPGVKVRGWLFVLAAPCDIPNLNVNLFSKDGNTIEIVFIDVHGREVIIDYTLSAQHEITEFGYYPGSGGDVSG